MIQRKWLFIGYMAILLGRGMCCATGAEAGIPIPLSFLPAGTQLSFCGEPVPVQILDVRERFEKEFMLITADRTQVLLWMKRSRRYLQQIEAMLKEKGMPLDLQYVSVIESALLPHAGSSKGAMGFWQFMDLSAKNYNLIINSHIDERRNLHASTAAAIRYFSALQKMFGSWTLAVAAYNMGEGALSENISEQGVRDYYRLSLSLETQRFLFRIICVKLIFSNPAAFGFELADEDYYPPFECDRVSLNCQKETPIRIIAEAASTYFKMIRDLNPEIRAGVLPPGDYSLMIPKGSAENFHPRLTQLMDKLAASRKERVYIVRKGDSLSTIAGKFRVSVSSLVSWNRLKSGRAIKPGDRLTLFQSEPESIAREMETTTVNAMD